jgi:cytosine/adenosine deaminase-related metal-dependent hydrolase
MYGADLLVKGNTVAQVAPRGGLEPPSVPESSIAPSCRCSRFRQHHHHFYQTLTRNLPQVQDAELFDWLVFLYERWRHIDEEAVYVSSALAMAELLKTGCTCTTDHHYLYPRSFTGDLMALQFAAAEKLGIAFSPTRGSMSLSKKDGGLPPDSSYRPPMKSWPIANGYRSIPR